VTIKIGSHIVDVLWHILSVELIC